MSADVLVSLPLSLLGLRLSRLRGELVPRPLLKASRDRKAPYLCIVSHKHPAPINSDDEDFVPRGKTTQTLAGGGKKGSTRPR
ncbi:hypothetical protein L227DRAFT_574333 [Lentinus tigrinus ALCF2SS1-6]|uniref:Uncharacterized protein n=1 Tax=Lentinus tigrinus ALCF2SS1-6 TaxID=1328759 RepID=A0A5C2SBS8_9APHY|nr:hypothetical protein L227DRAFT_574333 [Lentinus tigrinus ALCF2SS1-6]